LRKSSRSWLICAGPLPRSSKNELSAVSSVNQRLSRSLIGLKGDPVDLVLLLGAWNVALNLWCRSGGVDASAVNMRQIYLAWLDPVLFQQIAEFFLRHAWRLDNERLVGALGQLGDAEIILRRQNAVRHLDRAQRKHRKQNENNDIQPVEFHVAQSPFPP